MTQINYAAEADRPTDRATGELNCNDCPIAKFAIYGPTVANRSDDIHFQRMSVRKYAPNRTILAEGQTTKLLGTVRSGWAQKLNTIGVGRQHTHGILMPGDFLSVDLLHTGDHPLTYSVKAITEVTVCWFEADTIRRLLGQGETQKPWTQYWTHYYQAVRLARSAIIAEKSARARLAHFFGELLDRVNFRRSTREPSFVVPSSGSTVTLDYAQLLEYRSRHEVKTFDVPLTQAQIAQCLGLTTIYVNRILKQFSEERILEMKRGTVYVYDIAELTKIASEDV